MEHGWNRSWYGWCSSSCWKVASQTLDVVHLIYTYHWAYICMTPCRCHWPNFSRSGLDGMSVIVIHWCSSIHMFCMEESFLQLTVHDLYVSTWFLFSSLIEYPWTRKVLAMQNGVFLIAAPGRTFPKGPRFVAVLLPQTTGLPWRVQGWTDQVNGICGSTYPACAVQEFYGGILISHKMVPQFVTWHIDMNTHI